MSYDVFLSHNSQDKPAVRAVADWLRRNGVSRVWLDETEMEPGDRLTEKLGKAMEESRSAVIFIGPNGEGGWQSEEMDTLLGKAIRLSRQRDEFRIIPVLLPGATTAKLRWFLETRLKVDLSKGVTDSQAELQRLRQAILGKAGDPPAADDPGFSPYRGLLAFQVADAPFFFGRAAACRALAERLRDWRFACIIGPSGNGKSSLARAGLATEAAEAVIPGIRVWRRVTLVPGSHLVRAFLEQLYAGRPEHERAENVARALERVDPLDHRTTAEALAEALDAEFQAWSPDPAQPVLFLVDQLEELFTHRGLRTSSEAEREERIRRMLDTLALLAERGGRRWRFVCTLREEFYQLCRLSPAFWKLISAERSALTLDELDEEGWREAIKGPAARAGAYLETGLVEIMLKDVYRQRGSMPLLQLALHELWRRRQGACLTHDAYNQLGGVANALQTRAHTALQLLERENPEYLEIARNLFLRLTSLGDGVSDTRRRVDRAELDWEDTDPRDLEHVVTQLSDADHRLLVANEQSIEVTHDVLILKSEDIRAWLDGSGGARREIPVLRRLTHAARRWVENDRAPLYLNAADPPREIRAWAHRTRLRVTRLEREYLMASRAQRARDYRTKRREQQALRAAERYRITQAEERAAERERARLKSQRTSRIATGLAIAAALLSVAFGWSWNRAMHQADAARRATRSAQEALVNGFYRSIGVGGVPTPDEREALWELAMLADDTFAVRSNLLQRWCKSAGTAMRAAANEGWGSRAALGLYPHVGTSLTLSAALVEELEEPGDTDFTRLDTMNDWLAGLFGRMDPGMAATLGSNFVQAIEKTEPTEPRRLFKGLAALATRMESGPATELGKRLGQVLESPTATNLPLFEGVLEGLTALAARADRDTAGLLGTNIVLALENPTETDAHRLLTLSTGLVAIAGLLDPGEAAALATRGATILANALDETTESDSLRLRLLSEGLSVLAKTMERGPAAELAARCAPPLTLVIEKAVKTNVDRLSDLSEALLALAALSEPQRADELVSHVAELVVRALEDATQTNAGRLFSLSKGLSALAARTAPGPAAELAARGAAPVVGAMENPGEADAHRLLTLSEGLAALAERMERGRASEVAARGAWPLLYAIQKSTNSHAYTMLCLSTGLKNLAKLMDPGPAGALGTNLARELEKAAETDVDRLFALSKGLTEVLARLDPGPAAELAVRGAAPIVRALEGTDATDSRDVTDSHNLLLLCKGFSALARRMEPGPAATLAVRGARPFVHALNATETIESDGLPQWSEGLSALAEHMEARPAAILATSLLRVLVDPAETNLNRMRALSLPLAMLAGRIPRADHARIYSCSWLLLDRISSSLPSDEEPSAARTAFLGTCRTLSTTQLVEMLKWPFCVGGAEKIVLEELGAKKDGRLATDFHGSLGEFIRFAETRPELLPLLATPARRPRADDALRELEDIVVMNSPH